MGWALTLVSVSLTADEFLLAGYWRDLGYDNDDWFDLYYRTGTPPWGVPVHVVIWPRASAPDDTSDDDTQIDSDNDGVPDVSDGCRFDPNKTSPGECGCDEEETPGCGADADNDGVPDDQDLCPFDPDKVAPGECGCGYSDFAICEHVDFTEDEPNSSEATANTLPSFESSIKIEGEIVGTEDNIDYFSFPSEGGVAFRLSVSSPYPMKFFVRSYLDGNGWNHCSDDVYNTSCWTCSDCERVFVTPWSGTYYLEVYWGTQYFSSGDVYPYVITLQKE